MAFFSQKAIYETGLVAGPGRPAGILEHTVLGRHSNCQFDLLCILGTDVESGPVQSTPVPFVAAEDARQFLNTQVAILAVGFGHKVKGRHPMVFAGPDRGR